MSLQPRLAYGLGCLAVATFGFGLPVGMVLANKSATVALSLATLLALAAAGLGGAWQEVWRRHQALLRSPITPAAIAFIGVAVLSLTWSIDKPTTLRALGETLLMAYVGLVGAAVLPLVAGRLSGWVLVLGVVAGAVLSTVDSTQGMRLHGLLGERSYTFDLKRSLVVLVLLFWPAAGFLLSRGHALAALALLIFLAAATELVSAGTAAAGLGLASAAYLAARLAPRLVLPAVAVALGLALAGAPFAGQLAARILPTGSVLFFQHSHAAERLAIWSAFARRVDERPLAGYGFGASSLVYRLPLPGSPAEPGGEAVIAKLHPHNGYLQIWVELGIAGVIATAWLLAMVGRAVARQPAAHLPLHLALFVSSAVMALVGFGLWQPWWNASVASAIIWIAVLDERAGETAGG